MAVSLYTVCGGLKKKSRSKNPSLQKQRAHQLSYGNQYSNFQEQSDISSFLVQSHPGPGEWNVLII